ncbi:MAG: FeoB small GTPase domain-containing protein, partial [Bacteroidota bacterium]
MSATRKFRLALIGNPNSGKSSVFNRLTGLQQRVGNFPGVTVEKKVGSYELNDQEIDLVDFPGAYSFYPTSQDERIVVQTLANPQDQNYPDAVLYIADATRLEKHLLLFTQIRDLGLPTVLALNMADMVTDRGLELDTQTLAKQLGVPIVLVSSHTGEGFPALNQALSQLMETAETTKTETFYQLSTEEQAL